MRDPQDDEQLLRLGGYLSEAEFLQLRRGERKFEYIDGFVLQAGGSVKHNRIAVNMTMALEQHFWEGPCTVITSDVYVVLPNEDGSKDYFLPDLLVTCDRADTRDENTEIENPRLVIEVHSRSTQHVDKTKKLLKYQRCPSVHEIVYIDQHQVRVSVYSRQEDGFWPKEPTVYEDLDKEYISKAFEDLSIPMRTIYRRMRLEQQK